MEELERGAAIYDGQPGTLARESDARTILEEQVVSVFSERVLWHKC